MHDNNTGSEVHIFIERKLNPYQSLVTVGTSIFTLESVTYIGCEGEGEVQLGVPAPRFIWGGTAKVGACKSTLFTKSSSVVKITKLTVK